MTKGRGNPLNRRIAALRSQLIRAYKSGDLLEVMEGMRKKAVAGDPACAKVFMENVIGKPRWQDDQALIQQNVYSFTFNGAATPDQAKQIINAIE